LPPVGAKGLEELVPRSRSLKTGTLRAIIRHAGLSVEEFFELYR